jgi:hypothetical protein
LLVLVLGAAIPLFVYAFGQAELQRLDKTSEHAAFYHWIETSFYAAAIPLVALLTAFRPAAYRLAAWSAGLAAAVLGAASLAFSGYASALDRTWAWTAIVSSIAFVGAAEWERRRLRPAGYVASALRSP